MIVFSLAGMNVSICRKPIFHLLGYTNTTPMWIKVVSYILLIFPLYQSSLLFYGFFLGQFGFFWEKEKALGRFLKRKVLKIHTTSDK